MTTTTTQQDNHQKWIVNGDRPLKAFKEQSIDAIRQSGVAYRDPHFQPGITIVTNNAQSELARHFFHTFGVANKHDLRELDPHFVWTSCQVCQKYK